MNHNDAPQMTTYPSPPAPAHNGFYQSPSTQDQRQPDPEGLQLAAQLSGSLAEPMMRQSDAEAAHAQLTSQMEQSQNNPYENQQSTPLDRRMDHEGMDHGQASGPVYGTPGGTPGDMGEANKKRTKVSRACDECRRKKIRCDAYSEEVNCSNCKRVGTRCQFSRIPQKRGPSKGYIKELSDRVNNLEASQAQARHSMHPADSPYASLNAQGASPRFDDFSSPGPDASRKRQRSQISTDFAHNSYQGYPVNMDWQSRIQPTQQASFQPTAGSIVDTSHASYSADSMATPQFSGLSDRPSQVDASSGAAAQNGSNQAGVPLDWTGVLEKYYSTIHSMLPLLPSTQEKFLARVGRQHCPAFLEHELYDAVQTVNRCVLGEGAPRLQSGNPRSVLELIDAPGSRTIATNIIYLQIMLLRAVGADTIGPDSSRYRALWLGAAADLVSAMGLVAPIHSTNNEELDLDSDEALGRRLWWCLAILGRWHGLGTANYLLISNSSIVPTHQDKFLLGETAYQLARLSTVQCEVVALLADNLSAATGPFVDPPKTFATISRLLLAMMERCRETMDIAGQDMFHILHLHILCLKLTIRRIDPTVKPSELLRIVTETIRIFRDEYVPTPFNHHFAALAAFTLVDLRDVCGKEEANEGIQVLVNGSAGRNANNPGGDWHSAMMNLVEKKSGDASSSQPGQNGSSHGASLQHLADVATAEECKAEAQASTSSTTSNSQNAGGGDAENVNAADVGEDVFPANYDPGNLIRKGYLNVLTSYLPAPAQ